MQRAEPNGRERSHHLLARTHITKWLWDSGHHRSIWYVLLPSFLILCRQQLHWNIRLEKFPSSGCCLCCFGEPPNSEIFVSKIFLGLLTFRYKHGSDVYELLCRHTTNVLDFEQFTSLGFVFGVCLPSIVSYKLQIIEQDLVQSILKDFKVNDKRLREQPVDEEVWTLSGSSDFLAF